MRRRKGGRRVVDVSVPVITVSRGNSREHRMARKRRVSNERETTALALRTTTIAKASRYQVHLERVAPSSLDPFENLPMSMKAIADQVAAELGIDDRATAPIRFTAGQHQAGVREYAVEVTIRALGEDEAAWCPTCGQVPPS